MNADMHREKPLLLLFSEFNIANFNSLLEGNDDIILRQNNNIMQKHISLSESVASWNIQYEGVELDISLSESFANIHDYKKIFCNVDINELNTWLVISLGTHVRTGMKNSAIMASFFRLARRLVQLLQPEAIAWNITKIISDPDYFVDTIGHYENGGAFPILSTIDFIHESDERICSSGLAYFSEQEICYSAQNLKQADIMKRIMRIVHDIAVNGAYKHDMQLSGLEAEEKILVTVENPNLAHVRSIF